MDTAARILLCGETATAGDDLPGLLEQAGHHVARHIVGQPEPDDLLSYHLLVLEAGDNGVTDAFGRRFHDLLVERFVPLLIVTSDSSPAARRAGLENGAGSCLLRPFEPGELLAQVRGLLRLRALHHRVADQNAEVQRINHWLQQAHQRTDQELSLARRIQRSFQPQQLPELPRLRCAVRHRACGRPGGDGHDFFRLGEHHVGFYVADVMGQGMAAALLALFLQRTLPTLVPLASPGAVLQRLNSALLELGLAEKPFVALAYGVVDVRDGSLRFSRAGQPPPLYLAAERPPEPWKGQGSLLGVFPAEFPEQCHVLGPGDKVLFYTDGVEAVAGKDALLAGIGRHRQLPIEDFLEKLAVELLGEGELAGDCTLLGIEYT